MMKATVEKINLEISRDDSRELRNELAKINVAFNPDQYPKLFELDQLLQKLYDVKHYFIAK